MRMGLSLMSGIFSARMVIWSSVPSAYTERSVVESCPQTMRQPDNTPTMAMTQILFMVINRSLADDYSVVQYGCEPQSLSPEQNCGMRSTGYRSFPGSVAAMILPDHPERALHPPDCGDRSRVRGGRRFHPAHSRAGTYQTLFRKPATRDANLPS